MAQTSRYALPLLQAGQAQKEVTHNEAVARLDALVHLVVESRHGVAAGAAEGTTWIVGSGAVGAWAGHDGELAAFDDAGWSFVVPRDGCIAFVRDEAIFIHYASAAWRDGWAVSSLAIDGRTVLAGGVAAVATPNGGTIVDVEARTAVAQLLTALRAMGLIATA